MDLFNREIISYQLSERAGFDLVDKTLSKALINKRCGKNLLLHSDQGWQYQLRAYRHKLEKYNIIQSMSRKGNCLDNAVVENFFGTLKAECFYLNTYSCINQLKRAIKHYIYYYNNKRISLKLKGLSPVEYRAQFG